MALEQPKRDSRRGARGAIFVESLVVIMLLMVFLAGGMFFHRLYATKLRTIQDVRVSTWTKALGGCDDGVGGLGDLWGKIARDPADSNGVEADKSVSFVGAPEHTSGDKALQVIADPLIGGKSYNLATRIDVTCNEKKREGSLFDLRDQIIDMIPPIW